MKARTIEQLKRLYDDLQDCWLALGTADIEGAFRLTQHTLSQLQLLIDNNRDELGTLSYYVEEAKQNDDLAEGVSDVLEQLNTLGIDLDE